MKKQFYEENYKTCLFFARMCYYSIIGKNDSLSFKILNKLNNDKLDTKYALFGKLYSGNILTDMNNFSILFVENIPSISWIYKLPFINNVWSTNPKKAYQKWCKAFDGFFTNQEISQIIEENLSHEDGPARDFYADDTWTLIKEQEKYVPIISEIKWIYNRYKYDRFFVEKF